MSTTLSRFEDAYWSHGAQTPEFRHRQALEWIAACPAPVADIGCGDGLFLSMIREKGIDAWGVDVSEVAVQACKAKGLDASVSDFSNGILPDRPLRTGVLLDVLEHLFDPTPILRLLRDRASTVIVSVPNFGSLPARLQVLAGRVPENNTPRKGHIYWYTWKVLQAVLRKNGWKVVAVATNVPFGSKPVLGALMRVLARIRPSLFALSFVVKAERV